MSKRPFNCTVFNPSDSDSSDSTCSDSTELYETDNWEDTSDDSSSNSSDSSHGEEEPSSVQSEHKKQKVNLYNMIGYGWFSEEKAKNMKNLCMDVNGRNVMVTDITSSPCYEGNHKDVVYVGPVTKILSTFMHIPSKAPVPDFKKYSKMLKEWKRLDVKYRYGWRSKQQENDTGVSYAYKNVLKDGFVYVTHVTDTPYEETSYDDMEFVGFVSDKFITRQVFRFDLVLP